MKEKTEMDKLKEFYFNIKAITDNLDIEKLYLNAIEPQEEDHINELENIKQIVADFKL